MSPSLGGTIRRRFGAQQRLSRAFSLLALTGLACAALEVGIEEAAFTLGDNVTIAWHGGKEPVTLQLYFQDDESDRGTSFKEEIASNLKGEGEYEWETPKQMEAGVYYIAALDEEHVEAPELGYPFTVDDDDDNHIVIIGDINTPTDPTAPTETPTQSTTPPPTEEPPAEEEDPQTPPGAIGGGLTSGAKAGIGAGVGASSVAMFLIIAILMRRHRARRAADSVEAGETYPYLPRLRTRTPTVASEGPGSPRTPRTPARFTPTPISPSSSGILSHFPRSFTPKLVKAFSWGTATPSSARTPSPSKTPANEKARKVHVVGPLTELPAGDVDYEVPNRHELPTPANTPELPGSSHGDRSPRWE